MMNGYSPNAGLTTIPTWMYQRGASILKAGMGKIWPRAVVAHNPKVAQIKLIAHLRWIRGGCVNMQAFLFDEVRAPAPPVHTYATTATASHDR